MRDRSVLPPSFESKCTGSRTRPGRLARRQLRTAWSDPFIWAEARSIPRSLFAHRRFERKLLKPNSPKVVVAGFADAGRFDATWIPLLMDSTIQQEFLEPRSPDTDLVFFGTLAYEPNVAALRQLAYWWPEIRQTVPGIRMLVSGSRATDEVCQLARAQGWELEHDYPDALALCRRARLAIAPLVHATGIQTKVLEAARAGVPQVVTSAAVRGLDPDFPIAVADGAQEFAKSILELLCDETLARSLAIRAQQHVSTRYVANAYVGAFRSLDSGAATRSDRVLQAT